MGNKGIDILTQLQKKAKSVLWKNDSRNEYFCIFSKSGFSDALKEYAKEHKEVILMENYE